MLMNSKRGPCVFPASCRYHANKITDNQQEQLALFGRLHLAQNKYHKIA